MPASALPSVSRLDRRSRVKNCLTSSEALLPFIQRINSKDNFKDSKNMKKYIVPALKVEEAQVASMLAESLVLNGDTTVEGGDALTKENDWAIWSDDEE